MIAKGNANGVMEMSRTSWAWIQRLCNKKYKEYNSTLSAHALPDRLVLLSFLARRRVLWRGWEEIKIKKPGVLSCLERRILGFFHFLTQCPWSYGGTMEGEGGRGRVESCMTHTLTYSYSEGQADTGSNDG